MNIIQAIISGVVQGITEFLPISSSGHLVILHRYFGLPEPQILFDISLHIGTLGAIVFVFWREIINIARGKSGLGWALVIGSIPTAIIGLWLGNINHKLFGSVRFVGVMLLITALWLLVGSAAIKKRENKSSSIKPACRTGRALEEESKTLNWWQALIIGVSQGIAVIPGISRSGATISTAIILKRERNVAVCFSFLLSIPATLGAFFYQLSAPSGGNSLSPSDLVNILAGSGAAFIVGLVALKAVLKVIRKHKFHLFSIYCFLLGITVLVLG